jgi:LmbE family N-acetylglucosaminyl deacetylase
LAREAWYLSGLKRLAELDGGPEAKRPRRILHYSGHIPFDPTIVIDIGAVWAQKVELVRCYASQLAPAAAGDRGQHLLFGADILERMETKARYFGERIGVRYGEPLLHVGPLAPQDLRLLIS